MSQKEIEQILERYWNCETSIEEENILRHFFLSDEVPSHLSIYKSFFSWQNFQSEVCISDNFDQRILNQLRDTKILKPIKPTRYIYPFLKVAASVLIILSTGIGIYTHQMEEKRIEQTYSETYSDPELAMKEAQAALSKISVSLSKGSNMVQTLLATDTISISVPE